MKGDAQNEMKLFGKAAAVMLIVALILPLGASINGEEACENKGFGIEKCAEVGCCHWDDGQCWSSVGKNSCHKNNLLEGYVGWKDGEIVWSNPPAFFNEFCEKMTVVFGAAVCVTEEAWKEKTKCDHIVNVFYQYLDNDANGVPDDPRVHAEIVDKNYLLFVPATEEEWEDAWSKMGSSFHDQLGYIQMVGTWETNLNSCVVPSNRGASDTDRSTWSAFIDTDDKDCQGGRPDYGDASIEEILHLITVGAAAVYPSKWGGSFESEVGVAIEEANGNCGWGHDGNYVNPSSNKCSGQYAFEGVYNKNCRSCEVWVLVMEGIYWAVVSYIGGLYTIGRAEFAMNEWLMSTPDSNMEIIPSGVTNAISLEAGSPALYAMVSDSTSEGHLWLPTIMPNGNYKGFDDNPPRPTLPPAPDKSPTSSPTYDGTSLITSTTTSGCIDDKDFRFKNKEKKSCEHWVAKGADKLHKKRNVRAIKKRCRKKYRNKRVWEYCPATCALVDLGDCA